MYLHNYRHNVVTKGWLEDRPFKKSGVVVEWGLVRKDSWGHTDFPGPLIFHHEVSVVCD